MSDLKLWPSPAQFKAALDPLTRAGITVVYNPRWDDVTRAAHQAPQPTPEYCLLHHTGIGHTWTNAGTPQGDHISLGWLEQPFPGDPVPGIQTMVGRAGDVQVITSWPCYHAGAGGDGHNTWHRGDGPNVPDNMLNAYSYGLEMESSGVGGAAPVTPDNGTGYEPAQLRAAFLVEAAYLHLISDLVGHTVSDLRLAEHEDWTARKGGDTQLSSAQVQAMIHVARAEYANLLNPTPPPPAEGENMYLIRPNGWVYFLHNGQIYGVSKPTWDEVKGQNPPTQHLSDAAFTRWSEAFPVVKGSSL